MHERESFDLLQIVVAGLIQIYVALFVLFRIIIYEIRYVLHPTPAEQNYLIVFAVAMFSIHILGSGILLLRRRGFGRRESMPNLFILACVSIICLFFDDPIDVTAQIFCIILFCASVYFIYFLSRASTKKLFDKFW